MLAAALDLACTAGARAAVVHAQCTVEGFYRRQGFMPYGPTFIEDGLLHVAMRRALTEPADPR